MAEVAQEVLQAALRYYSAGDFSAAERIVDAVLRTKPKHPDALHLWGLLAHQAGRTDQAMESIRRAIAANPGAAMYQNNLGTLHADRKQFGEAIACYRRSLEIDPDYTDALANLALTYNDARRYDEAAQAFRQCIERRPDQARLYSGLGVALSELGRLDEARSVLERAIEIDPEFIRAYNNLGVVLNKQFDMDELLRVSRIALRLKPNDAKALGNLANGLKGTGQIEEAIDVFRQAVEADAEPVLHSTLAFSMNLLPDADPEDVYREHTRWAARHCRPSMHAPPPCNDPTPDRKLRVGYLSPDFYAHVVCYFIAPVLQHHNPDNVEVTCYSDAVKPDHITERLRTFSHRWRETRHLSDTQLFEKIREDEIDVLVDLAGHTSYARLILFAHRAAPVQATYLGYPNTTGVPEMDYRITDGWADPPGAEAWHSEQPIRLPCGFLAYNALSECPDVAPPPSVKNGFVTFGSFHRMEKINRRLLKLWSTILAAVPDSRLLVKAHALRSETARRLIIDTFAGEGIDRDRFEFRDFASTKNEHLAMHADVDIVLDAIPYNGTTTTCEALWMGVPVVTRAGKSHAQRVGTSLLSRLDLPELIGDDDAGYVQSAASLANNPVRLAELRRTLRNRMRRSTVCSGATVAASLEDAYRAMWRSWCQSQPQVGSLWSAVDCNAW